MTVQKHSQTKTRKVLSTTGKDLRALVRTRVPNSVREILDLAGRAADALNWPAYVVGGFVRDLIMAKGNFDLDLVVEGNGPRFARVLAQRLGGTCRIHERFQTAVITLSDKQRVDVATARTEKYARPAALPEVETADIHSDLFRRDFSINAMALRINGRTSGRLLDDFHGVRDLRSEKIRALHARSFEDDPTRIFRAIRFEQRYHFSLERNTARWMREALKTGGVEQLSQYRVKNEFKKIFAEEKPQKCFRRLEQMGFVPGPRFAPILRALSEEA